MPTTPARLRLPGLALLALGLPAMAASADPPPAALPRLPPPDAVIRQTGLIADIDLAWTAPADSAAEKSAPLRWFVEIASLAGSTPAEIWSGYTDKPSADVRLIATPGTYAWRVDTLRGTSPSYRPGPWSRFSIAPAAAASQAAPQPESGQPPEKILANGK